MKRFLLPSASLLFAAAIGLAAPRAVYRLDLRNGSHVLSLDSPVRQGSVMLFHLYPEGVLTSLPEEQVLRVRTRAEKVGARPLKPGEIVDVGPTGGHPTAPVAGSETVAIPIPGGVYDPRNPYYGYGGARYVPTTLAAGDLAQAVSAPPPTMESPFGSNGFPSAAGATPVIGSNGMPILAAGSTPVTIGPNGTPILAPPGAPGSTPPPIGSNGYPIR